MCDLKVSFVRRKIHFLILSGSSWTSLSQRATSNGLWLPVKISKELEQKSWGGIQNHAYVLPVYPIKKYKYFAGNYLKCLVCWNSEIILFQVETVQM